MSQAERYAAIDRMAEQAKVEILKSCLHVQFDIARMFEFHNRSIGQIRRYRSERFKNGEPTTKAA